MDLFERVMFMMLGGAIGFIVGYITRSLRDIKEELHETKEELDDVEEKVTRKKNERGVFRWPLAANLALGVVIILSVWASIASQKASNDVTKTQDRLETLITCNQEVLNDTINALHERTTYSGEQAQSNIALQQSFSTLLGVLLHQPPYDQPRQAAAVQQYYSDLQNFLDVSHKSAHQLRMNPYPSKTALAACISARN